MASITRARFDLINGGLARINDEVTVNKEGLLTYTAEYVCLEVFAASHASTFLTGAQPPFPLSSKLQFAAGLDNTPTLTDSSRRTENGLAFFSATYIAAARSAPQAGTNNIANVSPALAGLGLENLAPESTATITTEERSFSGRYEDVLGQTRDYQFDYTATSITVENINGGAPSFEFPSSNRLVSIPFNFTFVGGDTVSFINLRKGDYKADIIYSTRATYSSAGKYSVAETATGVYVSA